MVTKWKHFVSVLIYGCLNVSTEALCYPFFILEGQGKTPGRTGANACSGSDAQEAVRRTDATSAFSATIQTHGN